MKTPTYFLLFMCLTITLCLKPKPEAQTHLRGKIIQSATHEFVKPEEHNVNQPLNQHKQKLKDHDRLFSKNDHKKTVQNEPDHELFNHHSFSTSYNHKKEQNHLKNSQDWDSSSKTSDWHKLQGIRARNHKKLQQNHKLFDDETSSSTSSSDQRHKAEIIDKDNTQNDDYETIDQQTTDNSHKNNHLPQVNEHRKKEHKLESATSSYNHGSYHKMQEKMHNDQMDQMVRTRHHQTEVHDEYSQDSMDGSSDSETADDHKYYSKVNFNTVTHQTTYQMHHQNDLDQPHNGNLYYYVDENNVEHEVDSSSESSSFKQSDLRKSVDYNNPLDPSHPLVQKQTYFVTTEVPDTIGAGKGANFDEDSSVSSSMISEQQKNQNEASKTQGKREEMTYVPPPVETRDVLPPPSVINNNNSENDDHAHALQEDFTSTQTAH